MKNLRVVLSAMLFSFAVVAAVASNTVFANNGEWLDTVPNPDVCTAGVTDQSSCNTTNTGTQCTITVLGTAHNAFQLSSSCATIIKRP